MMDKIEKIKAELELRISRCEKKHPPLMSDKDFTDEENEIYCEECAYREILSFIDSLQDEPKPIRKRLVERSQAPEGKALYERVASEMRAMIDDDLEKEILRAYEYEDRIEFPKYKRIAYNFAKWQKERDHDACQSCENSRDVIFHNGIKHAIEQMKKEAVEGVVCKQRDSSLATWIEFIPDSLPSFDDCESVKCIILKDDDLQP